MRWPLQWLKPVLLLGDDECRRMVGLDGFVCIRYLRWCLKVCLFCSFWAGVVLMPLYSTGLQHLEDGFARLTMANVIDGSQRLWASAAFSALFNLYALYTINEEWKLYVKWRTEFLETGDRDAKGGAQLAYSVRVESLPHELRSDVALLAYFENLFPGQVHSAVVHLDLGKLQALIGVRLAECERLEQALAKRAAKRRARITLLAAGGGGGGGGSQQQEGSLSGNRRSTAPNRIGVVAGLSEEFNTEEEEEKGMAVGDNDDDDDDARFEEGDEPREWLFCTRVPGCDGGTHGRLHDFNNNDANAADVVMDGGRGVVDDDDEFDHNNGCCHGIAHTVGSVRYHRRRLAKLNDEVAYMQGECCSHPAQPPRLKFHAR
jgi:hypothetical protein